MHPPNKSTGEHMRVRAVLESTSPTPPAQAAAIAAVSDVASLVETAVLHGPPTSPRIPPSIDVHDVDVAPLPWPEWTALLPAIAVAIVILLSALVVVGWCIGRWRRRRHVALLKPGVSTEARPLDDTVPSTGSTGGSGGESPGARAARAIATATVLQGLGTGARGAGGGGASSEVSDVGLGRVSGGGDQVARDATPVHQQSFGGSGI